MNLFTALLVLCVLLSGLLVGSMLSGMSRGSDSKKASPASPTMYFVLIGSDVYSISFSGVRRVAGRFENMYMLRHMASYDGSQWAYIPSPYYSGRVAVDPLHETVIGALDVKYYHDNLSVMLHNLNIRDGAAVSFCMPSF